MEFNEQGVLALRNAIVEQAAKDYLKYYNTKGPQSSYVISIERWFRSVAFAGLATGYSGDWFIRNLREMAEKGEKIEKRKEYIAIKPTMKIAYARKVRRKPWM